MADRTHLRGAGSNDGRVIAGIVGMLLLVLLLCMLLLWSTGAVYDDDPQQNWAMEGGDARATREGSP